MLDLSCITWMFDMLIDPDVIIVFMRFNHLIHWYLDYTIAVALWHSAWSSTSTSAMNLIRCVQSHPQLTPYHGIWALCWRIRPGSHVWCHCVHFFISTFNIHFLCFAIPTIHFSSVSFCCLSLCSWLHTLLTIPKQLVIMVTLWCRTAISDLE